MSAVYNRLNLEPESALTNPIPNWLRLMRKDCGGSEVALWNKVRPHNGPLGAFVVRTLQICVLILAAIAMAAPLAAEDVNAPKQAAGRITGTVTDVDNDTVAGATVVLKGPVPGDPHTVVSDDDGFFEFQDLEPGTYSVGITANGFAAWTSPPIIVNQGQYVILTGTKLKIAEVMTTVSVDYSPEEVAIEQVRIEEEQRVLGIFPNFYVVFDHDDAPLKTKLKLPLEHRRRPGLGRSLERLRSAIQSRCGTGLPEFPYQHRRAHAQQPGTGVHLAQVVENQNRRIKASCER